jgi:hypothetical protein
MAPLTCTITEPCLTTTGRGNVFALMTIMRTTVCSTDRVWDRNQRRIGEKFKEEKKNIGSRTLE